MPTFHIPGYASDWKPTHLQLYKKTKAGKYSVIMERRGLFCDTDNAIKL